MDTVPRIISNSDLYNIEDMFTRNYVIFKQINSYFSYIKQEDIKELFEEILDMHYRHLYYLVNCLKYGEVTKQDEE